MSEETNSPVGDSKALFSRVAEIIDSARSRVVQTVNQELVLAYWSIGREIVWELQKGEERAGYGQRVIEELSVRLKETFGRGYSLRNLELFRKFYLVYSEDAEIPHTACTELATQRVANSETPNFHPKLSWSHYRILMRVEKPEARKFYEVEAANAAWSVRQLERQVGSLFYERLLKSQDKKGMLQDISQTGSPERAIDVIKDPYVLEFLDLPESHRLQEEDLETALIEGLQQFLLELGSGFAFVGRQKRITLEGDAFYPDLVFYHIRLRCYIIVDLKTQKLSHGDIGQMQMYVGYYDQEVRTAEENATIGLILCSDKNESMVRYVLGPENEQIFASKYRLDLPDEETLRRELDRERQLLENRK